MPHRYLLVILSALTAPVGLAEQSAWTCHQDEASQQWVCLDKQASTPGSRLDAPPVAAQPNRPPPQFEKPDTVPPAKRLTPEPAPAPPKRPEPQARPEKIETTPPEPQTTSWPSFNLRLLDPVFSPQQEQIFADLTSRLPADPWANCTLELAEAPQPNGLLAARAEAPVVVNSNYSEIFNHQIGLHIGQVDIRRADQHAFADKAHFNKAAETLDLQGNVYYHDDAFALHGDSAHLNLAKDRARLRNALFIAGNTPLRGQAKALYRDSKWLSHYQDVTYTSCPPSNQDWALHAEELKINQKSGEGAARHVWMEFKGVPVFYSPYLAFPVDNRRSSGLLAPSFGNTQTSGFILTTPYYWNIAPNYDATFSPTYFSTRGMLFGGNFRYLTPRSSGQARADYMPRDAQLDDSRHFLSLQHKTQFTQHLNANLDLNTVSDQNYFAEMGNALSFPIFSFVKSEAEINYLKERVAFTARAESYQTIDSSLSEEQIPYRRLPQLKLNLRHPFDFMPLDTAFEAETVNFQHGQLVDGQRTNLKPSVSLPLRSPWGYLTPRVSVQNTLYHLQNQPADLPETLSRTVPIASLDTGTLFGRDLTVLNKPLQHTLEPRLFYLYIPKTQQRDIPLFDTTLYDFWYQSLFRENRFSGSDRVQDANQLSVALTSKLLDPVNGRERLILNVGQIFYFRDRDVTLEYTGYQHLLDSPPPIPLSDRSRHSPLVVELASELSSKLSVDTGIQWDRGNNDIMRSKAMLHYKDGPGKIVNLGFLYRQDPLIPNQNNDITQSDMSFRWPALDTWHLVGRWQYSWLYNRTMDGFFGVEKENCCWRFRVIARTQLNSINRLVGTARDQVEGSPQASIFFQVELKGLTGLGVQLDEFFERSIFGYRKPAK